MALSGSLRLRAQEAAPTPEGALQRLKDGNARFAADKLAPRDISSKRRAELAKGQRPFAVVLTCADSRVAPELIFDQGLGDLFVLSVAGNITDPALLGSIEFAVEQLQAPLIVVLGHEDCGAVKAALGGKPLPGNLGQLIKEVRIGQDLPEDKVKALAAATRANVLYHTAAMTEKSPVIKEFVGSHRVRVVGGIYGLASGKITWLEVPEDKERQRR
jgi:carbonic anhydrase